MPWFAKGILLLAALVVLGRLAGGAPFAGADGPDRAEGTASDAPAFRLFVSHQAVRPLHPPY